jgi:hypothetical protein
MVMSRLRKINDLTYKISQDMPITYDIQQDYLYNKGKVQGIEQGIEKSKHEFVLNLVANTDFDDAKIALLANTPIDYVQKIRKEFHSKKKT